MTSDAGKCRHAWKPLAYKAPDLAADSRDAIWYTKGRNLWEARLPNCSDINLTTSAEHTWPAIWLATQLNAANVVVSGQMFRRSLAPQQRS